MRIKVILLGLLALVVSFAVSLYAMNTFWPVTVEKPVLAKLPPLPPVTRNSEILTPIAVSITALRDALDRAVDHILEMTAGKPHIFNLGHGILPQTPIAHVEQLLKRIRA